MSGVHGCCSFNCLPPILNLILIAFIDIFEIILNFLKFDADILEKKIYDEYPALAIINIFLHTISLFSSFATMLNKKNMNDKNVNTAISISSKIIEYVKIFSSFVNIFLISKGYVHFDNHDFLNKRIDYRFNYTDYSNIDRIDYLKGLKYTPFKYNQSLQTMIITDITKFIFINSSINYIDLPNSKKFYVIDVDIYTLLYYLEQILDILCAFNWGSVRTKLEILYDGSIKNELENYDEKETDCIANFIQSIKEKKYVFFSLIILFLDIIYIIFAYFLKMDWIYNNIVLFSFFFDLINLFFYLLKCNECCNDGDCYRIIAYFFCLFILLFLAVEFFSCILSFYSIYYSYKGNTFFYYYCYDDIYNCQQIFSIKNANNEIFHYDLLNDIVISDTEKYYFYFKIYLEKGDKTFFFLGLALRAIILLWNIITIANFAIYLNICGGFNTLRKVVSTIKDDNGVSVDINDFVVIIEELSNENDDKNSINDKRFSKLKRIQKPKPSEKIIRYRGRQNLNMNNGQTSSSNNLD